MNSIGKKARKSAGNVTRAQLRKAQHAHKRPGKKFRNDGPRSV